MFTVKQRVMDGKTGFFNMFLDVIVWEDGTLTTKSLTPIKTTYEKQKTNKSKDDLSRPYWMITFDKNMVRGTNDTDKNLMKKQVKFNGMSQILGSVFFGFEPLKRKQPFTVSLINQKKPISLSNIKVEENKIFHIENDVVQPSKIETLFESDTPIKNAVLAVGDKKVDQDVILKMDIKNLNNTIIVMFKRAIITHEILLETMSMKKPELQKVCLKYLQTKDMQEYFASL